MIPAPADVRLTQWASCAGCGAKMDALALGEILRRFPPSADPNLLVGMETGDDAGIYRIADGLALVQTVDFFPPIVDDPFAFGQIAAANALSDVYAMGGRPATAMNLVAFPKDDLPLEVLHEILRGGAAKLAEAGVVLVGGHSINDKEVKYGLAVTGLIDPACVVTNAGARPGDALVLTKPIGVGVVATALKQGRAAVDIVSQATEFMTRLNRIAAERMLAHGAHACTDITGYGLLGHALRMASASRVDMRVHHRAVPCLSGVLELLGHGIAPGGLDSNRRAFGGAVEFAARVPTAWRDLLFDPQTSGGLLIALAPKAAEALVADLGRDGLDAVIVGEVSDTGEGRIFVD